jgi:hypothetical protein
MGAYVKSWENAPKIVKGWAYPLSWLGIIFGVFAVLVGPFVVDEAVPVRAFLVLFWGAVLALLVWLNRGLKRGTQSAWTVQLILSIVGLLGFPLGTLINGYILSQWSKPEVKWWFDLP